MWEQAEEVDRAKQAYDYALKLNPKLASAQIGLQRVTGHSQ
jgi:cytochrome c-type biogenesis protein CcmH/NrfG